MLTVVCVVTLLLCVHYLQLRSQVIHQNETIAEMESALSRLKAENDAYADEAQASLDMETVKETALNELGLHYATESQIRYYNADDESYVRQYENVP
ncbi:MAG: septum formation initiator family protein [Eubacterium sp.]|nr:septum formation initiator family protein [Eubacterium sp.]